LFAAGDDSDAPDNSANPAVANHRCGLLRELVQFANHCRKFCIDSYSKIFEPQPFSLSGYRLGVAHFSMLQAGAYSPQTFFLFFYFFSPKLSYVPFVLARDHLGKLEMEK
jgi:hypothetical protein